jgi:hypothetical protein
MKHRPMTYIVKKLETDKTYCLDGLIPLTLFTGYSKGYLSGRFGNREFENYNLGGEYIVTSRLKRKDDVFYKVTKPNLERKLNKTHDIYDILIGEIDGFCYYIDGNKKLKKSVRLMGTVSQIDRVVHQRVTEADYKLFDIEQLFQEKFVEWRKTGIYRDDTALIKEFLDVIIIPRKHKQPTSRGLK